MGQMNTIGRPIGRGGATSRIYSRVGHRWPSFGRRSLGRLGLPGGRNVAQAGGFALGAARRGSSAKGWGGLGGLRPKVGTAGPTSSGGVGYLDE